MRFEMINFIWIIILFNRQLVHCQKPTPSKLKVLVREFVPYAIQEDDGSFRRGIDITMMDTIAKKMNVDVEYVAYRGKSVADITRHLAAKYVNVNEPSSSIPFFLICLISIAESLI